MEDLDLLEELLAACRPYTQKGRLASYIPELLKADIDALGVHIVAEDGREVWCGDHETRFTIQSIIKPVLLLLALQDNGMEIVRERMGVEATGKPFDAINYTDAVLDSQHLNPMVNMGAIVTCTLIKGRSYEERFQRLLALTRLLAQDPTIQVDEAVYRSEKSHGSKNRALAYLLLSYGIIQDDVEEVLDCYFKACSISVTCRDLANIGYVLAHQGQLPGAAEPLFPPECARYVNAILTTCGMYDGSGDFAIRVGVPAKSGVGGGIMAVVPSRMGIGIFSPGLDEKGNSLAGTRLLELLSRKFGLSIFG